MLIETKHLSGQSIFDLVVNAYGSLDYVYKYLSDNPVIESIDYDFDANPGQTFTSDDSIKTNPVSVQQNSTEVASDDLSEVCISNQSIFDMCLMTYGSLDFMFKLLQDSGIDSVNTSSILGKSFNFKRNLISDLSFYDWLRDNKIVIGTAAQDSPNAVSGRTYNISYNQQTYN